MAQSSIHDLESGKTKSMRDSTLLQMAKALGQPAEWLAFGNDPEIKIPVSPRQSKFEQDFLDDFRKLSGQEKKIVIRLVRSLTIDK
jgi:hypothetical protein